LSSSPGKPFGRAALMLWAGRPITSRAMEVCFVQSLCRKLDEVSLTGINLVIPTWPESRAVWVLPHLFFIFPAWLVGTLLCLIFFFDLSLPKTCVSGSSCWQHLTSHQPCSSFPSQLNVWGGHSSAVSPRFLLGILSSRLTNPTWRIYLCIFSSSYLKRLISCLPISSIDVVVFQKSAQHVGAVILKQGKNKQKKPNCCFLCKVSCDVDMSH